MSDTTDEEARRCPKCKKPGEVRKTEPAKNMPTGTKIQHVFCVTDRCKWFDTPWMVQVNPDGTIPPATDHKGKPKQYQGFEGHDELAQQLIKAVQADDAASIRPGSEIRRRSR